MSSRQVAATAGVPPIKTSKKRKAPAEKRLRRFRSSCPAKIQQRIDRAVTQRLYLVQRGEVAKNAPLECTFVVLGSTGNIYTVTIAQEAACDCPDHQKNKSLCKHILFVLLKVMGLPRSSPLIYQAAWLTTELQEMFQYLDNRRVGGSTMPLANQRVRSMYAKIQSGEDANSAIDIDDGDDGQQDAKVARKSLEEDSDCPICFDSMAGSSPQQLTYCRAMCGTNFHSGCIEHWKKSHQGTATCPTCRQPWEEATATAAAAGGGGGVASPNAEGYANLGSIQGQSPVRDTSTYHYSPYAYYKRRRYR